MNSRLLLLTGLAISTVVGCQPAAAPAPDPTKAEVKKPAVEESDLTDRMAMAYDLLDGRFSRVRFDSSAPVKVVVEVKSKGIPAFKDWFIAGKGFNETDFVDVAFRPVDNGELSKARRIRYGIRTKTLDLTHLVKNPFIGLSPGKWHPPFEAKAGQKPIDIFTFESSPAAPAVDSASATTVRVGIYKATPEDLKQATEVKHSEGAPKTIPTKAVKPAKAAKPEKA